MILDEASALPDRATSHSLRNDRDFVVAAFTRCPGAERTVLAPVSVARPRVAVVECLGVVRTALCLQLERGGDVDIAASTGCSTTAVHLLQQRPVDVVIAAVSAAELANGDAMTLFESLGQAAPHSRVLALTEARSECLAAAAFDAGADAYVLKQSPLAVLRLAIRALHVGRLAPYVDPQLNDDEVTVLREQERARSAVTEGGRAARALTPREREVLALIGRGARNREIADELGIALKTVETHRLNLINKLDARNVPSLVRWALRLGLTSL